MPIVTPTSGQLQIPGAFQSVARIICSVSGATNITVSFTEENEPQSAFPYFGWIAWRYDSGGVQRYGHPQAIELQQMLIVSDQPQLEFDQLLVVPRLGVNINASLRRIQI